MKNKNKTTKSYDVVGSYRGDSECVVNTLVGDDKKCELNNGINGDGCDEFSFEKGIDEVIKIGIDIGLWKLEDNKLVELYEDEYCDNMDKWNEFYDLTEAIESEEGEDF